MPDLFKPATFAVRSRTRGVRASSIFSAFLLLCLSVIAGVATSFAEPIASLQPTGYVNDFAGVLSPATRSQLEALCKQVDQQAHAQIAVVTIHTTGDDPIDDYAVRLEEKWKVGPKGSDRGILLLLATDDHKYRFEIGYGLEGILPDGLVGGIGRQMVPYLRQNDYDSAVTLGVQSVAKIIANDAHITLDSAVQNPAMQHQPRRSIHDIFLAVIAIVFFIWLLRSGPSGLAGFLLGMFLGGLGGGGRGGGDFGGGGGDGGGFGGFGGGSSGGGGASGSW